jgi:hypothetical protein
VQLVLPDFMPCSEWIIDIDVAQFVNLRSLVLRFCGSNRLAPRVLGTLSSVAGSSAAHNRPRLTCYVDDVTDVRRSLTEMDEILACQRTCPFDPVKVASERCPAPLIVGQAMFDNDTAFRKLRVDGSFQYVA